LVKETIFSEEFSLVAIFGFFLLASSYVSFRFQLFSAIYVNAAIKQQIVWLIMINICQSQE